MINRILEKNRIHETPTMSYFLGTICILVMLSTNSVTADILKYIPIEIDPEQKLLVEEILAVLLLIHVLPYFLKFFYIKKINNFFIKIVNFNNMDFKNFLYFILSLSILVLIYFLKISKVSGINFLEYLFNGSVDFLNVSTNLYQTVPNLDVEFDFLLLSFKYSFANFTVNGINVFLKLSDNFITYLKITCEDSFEEEFLDINNSKYYQQFSFLKFIITLVIEFINKITECCVVNSQNILNSVQILNSEYQTENTDVNIFEKFGIIGILPQIDLFTTIKWLYGNVFLDGVSLWLVWLTALIGFILAVSGYKKNILIDNLFFKKYYIYNKLLNFIILLMFVCFLTKDIFIFFTAFEMILIPLFSYIILQGSRLNKIFAVKYLFIYTVVGSLFLWYGVSYIVEIVGSTNYDNVRWLFLNCINIGSRKIIFISLFLGFAFKIPLVPFHHWLIIAHVEAPTSGSIILAALLLKVGGYGLYRFVFNLFPIEVFEFSNEIMALSLFGFTYATAMAIRQIDVKRYIAYTSIAHMNYALLGLFSCQDVGILGYIHIMISHGIIATAMFFLIGHVYSALSFRDTLRLGGLAYIFPKFSVFFFIFSLANMGLPLFSGFPGEFLILVAIINTNEFYGFVVLFGFMLSGIYNFFQLNKILFSSYSNSIYLKKNCDLGSNSILILATLLFWSVSFGLSPDIIIQNVEF